VFEIFEAQSSFGKTVAALSSIRYKSEVTPRAEINMLRVCFDSLTDEKKRQYRFEIGVGWPEKNPARGRNGGEWKRGGQGCRNEANRGESYILLREESTRSSRGCPGEGW